MRFYHIKKDKIIISSLVGDTTSWEQCGLVDLWSCFFSMEFVFSGDFSYEIARDPFFFLKGAPGHLPFRQNCQMYGGQNQMNHEKTLVV